MQKGCMMNIRKAIKLITIAATAVIMFSGCASTQYQSDENVKKSIVILIQKVERLEALQGMKSNKIKSTYIASTPAVSPTGPMTKTLKRDISVFSKRNPKSKITAAIRMGTVIEISGCDKYGWCTLKGQKGFIQRWKVLN